MAEGNFLEESQSTRLIEKPKTLPKSPKKNFLLRPISSIFIKKNQEEVKPDGKSMHEQATSLADLRDMSQSFNNISYGEKEKELVDALLKHSNLLTESSRDISDIDFTTSLVITKNFFTYYKERITKQGIYDKHPKRNLKIDPTSHQLADFCASFLFNNMQGIGAKMNEAQNLEDRALLIETVSNLARFGKDNQRIEAVSFLVKHFDRLLKEFRSEYVKDEIPYPKFKDTFFALGTIFEKGTPEQFEVATQIIMGHFHGEDNEMKKFIADNILKGIEDKEVAKEVVKVIVSGYNINPEEAVKNWSMSTMKGYETFAAGMNLKTMVDLESQIPGICSVLYSEFGITDFARYPRSLLVAQYEDRDKKDSTPYGVIVFPKADWNEAFYKKANVLEELQDKLEGRYRIRAFEIGGVPELIGVLNRSRKKWGEISFAIIGGHGTPRSIRFGVEDNARGTLKKEDVERQGASAVKTAFVESPTIILSSCSTGELGGIGQEISRIGGKVIAPQLPTHPESIDPIFLSDGKVDFRVKYNKTVSNEYSMGEPQAPIMR